MNSNQTKNAIARTVRLALVALLAACVALPLGSCKKKEGGAAGGKIVLKVADDHNLDYPTVQGLVFMDEYLKGKTDGRISLEIHPAGEMGGEKETIENTQMGVLDMDRISIAPLAEHAPILNVLGLPYLFNSVEHQWAVLDGPIGEKFLDALKDHKMIGLAFYDSGARSFYNSKRPINSPEDLKGLKIRVQKSELMLDLIDALGADPQPMAFEEVYSSLQTGVIDGAENNPPSYFSKSHYEVAKYYSLDEHARVPDILIASKMSWDKLSAEDQALLKEAAAESAKHQRKLWAEMEETAMAKVQEAGCKINRPDKAPFQALVEPLYKKFGGDYMGLIDEIKVAAP